MFLKTYENLFSQKIMILQVPVQMKPMDEKWKLIK